MFKTGNWLINNKRQQAVKLNKMQYSKLYNIKKKTNV